MSDFDDKLVDNLVENGPSLKDMGISESAVSGASVEKPKEYDRQNPPPAEDKASWDRHLRALNADAIKNDERFDQGLKAAQDSIKGVPGATLDVKMQWNSAAGKEVPVVNTYTPKQEDLPQVPLESKVEK